jgi:hypothetical protein
MGSDFLSFVASVAAIVGDEPQVSREHDGRENRRCAQGILFSKGLHALDLLNLGRRRIAQLCEIERVIAAEDTRFFRGEVGLMQRGFLRSVVEVITRPCQAGATAMRRPSADSSTMSVCSLRKATSSP